MLNMLRIALSLKGRIDRKTYIRNFILFFCFCGCIYFIPICENQRFVSNVDYIFCQSYDLVSILIIVINLWWFTVTHVKRCHDLNRPWKYLLSLKSNITLFTEPGTNSANFYGPPPKK